MRKQCDGCATYFADGEEVMAIVRTKFKLLPSKVHFALALPEDVHEVFHCDCFLYEMGGGNQGDDRSEV